MGPLNHYNMYGRLLLTAKKKTQKFSRNEKTSYSDDPNHSRAVEINVGAIREKINPIAIVDIERDPRDQIQKVQLFLGPSMANWIFTLNSKVSHCLPRDNRYSN